jgi:phosphoglycolate phosphatase
MAHPDPILFDLDGTITESGPGVIASVRYALDQMGEPMPADDQFRRFIGPPLADSFRDICGMDAARVQLAIATYREFYAEHGQFDSSVYAGIPEVLAEIRRAGRTLAVATSKARVFAESILDHHGLRAHFHAVAGAELDGTRTRKADVIRHALEEVGMPAGSAVLVGDRYHDVYGATSVGLPCIGALWGYGSAEELTSAGAAGLAATPADLLPMLGI